MAPKPIPPFWGLSRRKKSEKTGAAVPALMAELPAAKLKSAGTDGEPLTKAGDAFTLAVLLAVVAGPLTMGGVPLALGA